jgi:hypothetical protein
MFTLDEVVPWGRSFDEYRRMFALSDDNLSSRILGCGDGPASFNAEATRRGTRVVSCDPLYRFDGEAIRSRIAVTADCVLAQTRLNEAQFVWRDISSIEHLAAVRIQAMNAFLDDYGAGGSQGRYVAAELPALPFADRAFDLAICSHLLFLYSVELGQALHAAGLREMCRVAAEVRVFPLVSLSGDRSPFVDVNVETLEHEGFSVRLERVPYEFQRGADTMMRIRARSHERIDAR